MDTEEIKILVWRSYEDKFSRFRIIISELSNRVRFENAILQWKIDPNSYRLFSNICICSETENIYHCIRNVNNSQLVPICCNCIIRFGNKEIVDTYNKIRKITKYVGNKRLCVCCCNYKILEDNDNLRCLACVNGGNETVSQIVRTILISDDAVFFNIKNDILERRRKIFLQQNIANDLIPTERYGLGELDLNQPTNKNMDNFKNKDSLNNFTDLRHCLLCNRSKQQDAPMRYRYCEICYRARFCEYPGCSDVILNDKPLSVKYCSACIIKTSSSKTDKKCKRKGCDNDLNNSKYEECIECYLRGVGR